MTCNKKKIIYNKSQVAINSLYNSINFLAFYLKREQVKIILCVCILGGKMAVVAETQKGIVIHPDLRKHEGKENPCTLH